MGPDWSGNVLDLLLTHVFEGKVELVANLVANNPADTDPARLSQCLETRRDVYPVSVNVPLIDDDVAKVDPHAELDATFDWHARVALDHLALHVNCAAYRVDYAGKFDEQAIPCGFDNPAAVLFNLRVCKLAPKELQRGERSFLIRPHQPRIAGDVGRQDRREPSLDPFLRHRTRPPLKSDSILPLGDRESLTVAFRVQGGVQH